MKACITKNKYRILAAVLTLMIWNLMSRVYPPLVVPPIGSVGGKIVELLQDTKMWKAVGETVFRMFIGLSLGTLFGGAAGILGGIWKPFRQTWQPIQGIIQVVPPVSWLILAIIWFGYNGKASIFIVVMAVMPSITICVTDGVLAIDQKLVEMSRVFRFPFRKMLKDLYIPSVLPYFYSGLKIAVGTACKTIVMGEVLTTTTGIGGQITNARMNIEPETVIAWTVITVGIYFTAVLSGKLLQQFFYQLRKAGRKHA